MHVAHKVKQALSSNNRDLLIAIYQEVFSSMFDTSCSQCYDDARIELQVWLNKYEREQAPINLFISMYEDRNPLRQRELDFCFEHNKSNEAFTNVINLPGRPTYNDFFEATKDHPDAVNIIANTDIFFDDTIKKVRSIKEWECYALTRWDYSGNGHAKFLNRRDSQDVWVFRGAVNDNVNASFTLGRPGCDNAIAYKLKEAGYIVSNPSISIHCLHYHVSQVRNFQWGNAKDTIARPYHFIYPTSL